jgi:hypothetical protein
LRGFGWGLFGGELPLLDHYLHLVVADCGRDLRRTQFELEIENSNKTVGTCSQSQGDQQGWTVVTTGLRARGQ